MDKIVYCGGKKQDGEGEEEMRTAKNKKLMKLNIFKHRNFKIKKLLQSESISGEPFSRNIGDTFKQINKLRGKK